MLGIFMYPVSGIMKLWHLIFSQFLSEQHAWIISIVLLVVTVRGLVAPLSWASLLSGRKSALMRPEQLALQKRLEEATTVEEVKELKLEEEALRKRFGFNPVAGCVPAFILIPVFLGLYQVVLRLARPSSGETIGLLNAHEIESFRASSFEAVPLPAYVSMPADWANNLGVTGDQVREVIFPWLILALIFTTTNMVLSLYRSFLTTQFDRSMSRRVLIMVAIFVLLTPMMLWNVAMHGPIPVAIIIYWVCNNLFTLSQNIVFELRLRRNWAVTDELHELRRESMRAFVSRKRKKERKAARAERKAETPEQRAERKEKEKRRREMNTEAIKQIRQERMKERAERQAAQKAQQEQKGQAEQTDNAASSGEPTAPGDAASPDDESSS